MGRRSWIFFLYSKETAEKIKSFCKKNEYPIFIGHYVIINGSIESKEGIIYGNDSDKTPALLIQSDGESIVREMVNQKIIDYDDYIYLGNIARKELEDTGDGYKLKKATYLSEKEFFEIVENKSFTKRNIEF
jgi:hypothetical protein